MGWGRRVAYEVVFLVHGSCDCGVVVGREERRRRRLEAPFFPQPITTLDETRRRGRPCPSDAHSSTSRSPPPPPAPSPPLPLPRLQNSPPSTKSPSPALSAPPRGSGRARRSRRTRSSRSKKQVGSSPCALRPFTSSRLLLIHRMDTGLVARDQGRSVRAQHPDEALLYDPAERTARPSVPPPFVHLFDESVHPRRLRHGPSRRRCPPCRSGRRRRGRTSQGHLERSVGTGQVDHDARVVESLYEEPYPREVLGS